VNASLLAQEWALLRRDRAFVAACLLLVLLCAYASWSGIRWQQQRLADFREGAMQLRDATQRETGQLAAIEAGRLPIAAAAGAGLPHVVRTELALPPAPLAGVAIGEAELRPMRAVVAATTRAHEMFRFQEVDNPVLLGWGRFDLAFVMLVLLPLLWLGFGCTVLAADRDTGTLGFLLSHPIRPLRLALVRVLLRCGTLTVVVLVAATLSWLVLGAAAGVGPGAPGLAALAAVLVAYAAFWGALALWIASRNRSSERNALLAVLLWTLLVLVVPALSTLVARQAAPVPSRLEYITSAREAENEASARGRELLQGYLLDHPELEATRGDAVAPFIKTFVLVQREVERGVAPIVRAFESAEDAQRRLAAALRWLSPRDLAEHAVLSLAGHDPGRFARFEQQARALRAAWLAAVEDSVIAGRRLSAAEHRALPRPAFDEAPQAQVLRGVLAVVVALLAFAALAAVAAARNLRRFSPAADD
jgi:ABC-2 type transport system permease protein